MTSKNNFPNTLPSLERFIQRVRAAEKGQAKDIRLSIQEAREMVSDIAMFTTNLAENLNNLNTTLAEIKESTTKIDVKFDGGGF